MKKKLIAITAILATTLLTASVLALTDGTYTIAGSAKIVQCEQDSDCIPTTLFLCTKDATWQCINGPTATLTFDQSGAQWHLTTNGLQTIDYALIYKPDQANRFTNWNGAGGRVLATFAENANNMAVNPPAIDLPDTSLPDWNINPVPNYCNNANGFDSYLHCNGAKIWIVPVADLTSGPALPLNKWNPNAWLFETDLIRYSQGATSACVDNVCEITPAICGMTATGNVGFGDLVQGAVKQSGDITTVTNTGNVQITPYISGIDWTDINVANTMPVGATQWYTVSKGWNILTNSATSIGVLPNNGDSKNVVYQLTVPSPQPIDTYTQTITFTGSC